MTGKAQSILLRDQRRDERYEVDLSATLILAGQGFTCTVKDISAGGVAVHTDLPVQVGQTLTLHISEMGEYRAEVVHIDDDHIGFKFLVVDRRKQERLIEGLAAAINDGITSS